MRHIRKSGALEIANIKFNFDLKGREEKRDEPKQVDIMQKQHILPEISIEQIMLRERHRTLLRLRPPTLH